MGANRYGSFLTIILIVVIAAVLIGGGIFVYLSFIKPNIQEKKSAKAILDFDESIEEKSEQETAEELSDENVSKIIESSNSSNKSSGGSGGIKRTYYDDFVMLGYITISKTNVKLPILESATPKALEKGACLLYPSSPRLNEPGNTVLAGHNYRNGRLFSNNKKLSVGDKIKIKDESGRELVYTIYSKFETTPSDTSFYTRDTGRSNRNNTINMYR